LSTSEVYIELAAVHTNLQGGVGPMERIFVNGRRT